jgi:pilus assembly protein Flp/PilA
MSWTNLVTSGTGFAVKAFVNRFVRAQSGATAIEYGLIAARLSVEIVGVVAGLRPSVNTAFPTARTALK